MMSGFDLLPKRTMSLPVAAMAVRAERRGERPVIDAMIVGDHLLKNEFCIGDEIKIGK